MKQLISRFFHSSGDTALDEQYKSGVLLLKSGDYTGAARALRAAAASGHVSALYNLALMYKQGLTESFEIEKAIDLFKQAAERGHEQARLQVALFEQLGNPQGVSMELLTYLVTNFSRLGGDGAFVFGYANEILCTTRDREELTDFVFMELDRANQGEVSAKAFVQSTGIARSLFEGSLGRSGEGSLARMQSDRLNQIEEVLAVNGIARASVVFARCSVVGCVIKKSGIAPMGALLPYTAYTAAGHQFTWGLAPGTDFVFTSRTDPKLELQTRAEALAYVAKLKKATRREDLYIELANVMAAKYALMSMPTSVSEFELKQKLVTELTDKATCICGLVLSTNAIVGRFGTDLSEFNGLVMELDEQLLAQNLEPAEHGEMLLSKLREYLS
jgi:hypothetical protein